MRGMSWCERMSSLLIVYGYMFWRFLQPKLIVSLLFTSWSVFGSRRSSANPCWTRTNCWIKGMMIWLRLSRRWRRNSRAWQRRTLRWSAQSCTWITCVLVFIGPPADFSVGGFAEGEDQLTSAAEEAEVLEWPGSGARWTRGSLSEASGPGAAKHHRWPDQSKCVFFLIITYSSCFYV